MSLKLTVYGYESPEAPEHRRAVAHIHVSDGDTCPVVVYGRTKEEAMTKAQTWLDKELEKQRKPDGRTKEGRALKAQG